MNTELEMLKSEVFSQLAEAAKKADLGSIQRLARAATDLEELSQQRAKVEQQTNQIAKFIKDGCLSEGVATGRGQSKKMRELPVKITGGMLRQNYLSFTEHLKRRSLKIGDEFVIEALPSGDRFKTVLLEKGNKLQARSEIASFFKDASVQEGDYILLTETAQGGWTLRKAAEGEYKEYDFEA
jgi:hypothetical protein